MSFTPIAVAADFTVTRTDDPVPGSCQPEDCSLREAIITSNDTHGADRVILGAEKYLLTQKGTGEDDGSTGDLDITDDITITGVSSATTIIDGNGIERVLHIITGNVSINRIAIQNGGAKGDGAIRFYSEYRGAELSIIDSRLSDNSYGAVVRLVDGTLVVRNSAIVSNTGDRRGGGLALYIDGDTAVTITNSVINYNVTDGAAGIYAEFYKIDDDDLGSLTILNSDISNNSAVADHSGGYGGGIAIDRPGIVHLEGVEISHNSTKKSGGGISIRGVPEGGSTITILDSAIEGNTAVGYGGGIGGGSFTISDSTISNNTAGWDGGGIYGGSLSITNSTINSNTADGRGGGIANVGSLSLTGITVTRNTAGDAGGGISTVDYADIDRNIRESVIAANSSGSDGGGIHTELGTYCTGRTIVYGSTISDNTAVDRGGGISNSGCTLVAESSGIFSNTARYGGGLANIGGYKSVLQDSTVATNTAEVGGGIWSYYGTIIMSDSRLLFNSAIDNGGALFQEYGTSSLVNSCIVGNSDIGMVAVDVSDPIAAKENWWGTASGPSGEGYGFGDSVSSRIDYAPYKTTPILECPTLEHAFLPAILR